MKELYKKYKRKGVVFIGVSIDKRKKNWIKCLEKLKLPWINICDTKGKDADNYLIRSVPTLVLIDREGKIVNASLKCYNIEENIKKLLKD